MWGSEWDLPTLIKNCQDTKFKGVELRTTHKHGVEIPLSKQQRGEVAQRFADSGIILVGLGSACEYHSADPAVVKKNIEETKAFIELCHDVGGSGVKVRPNGLTKGKSEAESLAQIGAALRECAEFGAGYGVEIRLEVHGKDTSDLPRIKTIMEHANHEGARVCWNSNPGDMNGKGLAANFEMVRKYFGQTMHIHDLTSDYPWMELFGLLKKSKYEGWTLVEEGKTADPVRVMKYYRMLWDRMTAAA
ncbi:MAG: TIM barrel protein [Planctomycetota bacterium]|nr:TIM barrel protein [Planctomycetota bacterium]